MSSTQLPYALDAKRIGANITFPDEWLLQRDDVMQEILEAKFEQVIEFKESVLKSGDSALFVEAAFDDYWGSGLDKRGTSKSSVTSWPGKNVMGRILTNIARSKQERPLPQRNQPARSVKVSVSK